MKGLFLSYSLFFYFVVVVAVASSLTLSSLSLELADWLVWGPDCLYPLTPTPSLAPNYRPAYTPFRHTHVYMHATLAPPIYTRTNPRD